MLAPRGWTPLKRLQAAPLVHGWQQLGMLYCRGQTLQAQRVLPGRSVTQGQVALSSYNRRRLHGKAGLPAIAWPRGGNPHAGERAPWRPASVRPTVLTNCLKKGSNSSSATVRHFSFLAMPMIYQHCNRGYCSQHAQGCLRHVQLRTGEMNADG